MEKTKNNPTGNRLTEDFRKEDLVAAIGESGYPLQSEVASKLTADFHVREEWGFFDFSTKMHRSLDVFAFRSLKDEANDPIQPGCVLLIECKRARQPYIFFQQINPGIAPDFPHISGMSRHGISISERGERRSRTCPASQILGLDGLKFVQPGPPSSAAFSKAVRKGKKLELSGTDPFNSLILPLVRALDHTMEVYKPNHSGATMFPYLISVISVLDAPMVLVEGPDQISEPVLTPWVRIVRQEAIPDTQDWKRFKYYSIEVIHIDYFDRFIREQLLPFSYEFAERAVKMGDVLRRGGNVANLDAWTWDQIKPREKKQ